MNKCLKCGSCCRNIFINDTIFDSNNSIDKECALFIMEHWEVIKTYPDGSYYKCTLLNEETNQCIEHERRPYTCSGFPLYGRDKMSEKELKKFESCGYTKGESKMKTNRVEIIQGIKGQDDKFIINGVSVLTKGYTITKESGAFLTMNVTLPIEVNGEFMTAINADIISITPKGEEERKEYEEDKAEETL